MGVFVAEQITHQPKNREDESLARAIEFLRQADAKKRSAGAWGRVYVGLDYEDGAIKESELNESVTTRKKKAA
jgi:hypothetical protein